MISRSWVAAKRQQSSWILTSRMSVFDLRHTTRSTMSPPVIWIRDSIVSRSYHDGQGHARRVFSRHMVYANWYIRGDAVETTSVCSDREPELNALTRYWHLTHCMDDVACRRAFGLCFAAALPFRCSDTNGASFACNRCNRSTVTTLVNCVAAKNAGILRTFRVLPQKKAVTGFGI